MKLYYARGACSLGPHILLHEIGAKFEAEAVDLKTKKTASGANFLDINPKGYVPALVLNNGELLTEAAIVLQYIADQKPDAKLLGAPGTLERYRALEWTHFVSTEIHKSYSPLFAADTPAEYKDIIKKKLIQRLTQVDGVLSKGDYLMGAQYTIADAYLFVTSNWMKAVGLDAASFPNLAKFKERVAARPAVQAAMKAEGLLK
ncbi:MAG: glutathione transferase GstA [Steroidobacteraceae bacterium]